MDSPEWLRTQLVAFNCPACGRLYRDGRIRLLAEREGLYFVDIDCAACSSHTVAIISVELNESELTIADASDIGLLDASVAHLGEELPIGASPVTADDVLEMHEFLVDFDGDIEALLAA